MMFERPRGTRDFGPKDMLLRRRVENAFRKTCESFGFREIGTPTFENLELFTARSGPGIVKELYDFKDKGGRELALRPEFTASIMRLYANDLRNEPKPIKVYTMGNCFRYEEPQMGRYREFWQYNCEIIGAPALEADAEIIALAIESLKGAGLNNIDARIGHIGMLRSYLKTDREAQSRILHCLDKRDFGTLREELRKADLSSEYETLRDLVYLKGGPEVLDEAGELLKGGGNESLSYLRDLSRQLSLYGITDYVFDLGVVRGLDYYTGMVFEIDSPNLGAEKQVGGGGAYDLSDVFGFDFINSTGFAIGVDRVALAAEAEGLKVKEVGPEAFVIPIGDAMREKGFEVLRDLRTAGVRCDIDLVGKGPSKNLEYASSLGVRWAVLVGEDEWKRGAVALRDLDSGEQIEIPLKEIADKMLSSR